MSLSEMPDDYQMAVAPLDQVDHVRGSPIGRLILEYGDYECRYSRQAFHAIELVTQLLGGNVRVAFRHFPLTRIHPHALAAAAAALQGRFWAMHELLLHRQKALGDGDLLSYAAQLGLDAAALGTDRASPAVLARIQRDVDSGIASGQVLGTPTLVHRRRLAPRWLRPAHPAGRSRRAGLMTLPARRPRRQPPGDGVVHAYRLVCLRDPEAKRPTRRSPGRQL